MQALRTVLSGSVTSLDEGPRVASEPASIPEYLKPPSPLEPQDRQDSDEYDQREAPLIAPSPSELWHVLEIHSVDARYEGWLNSHNGDTREGGVCLVVAQPASNASAPSAVNTYRL